MKNVSQIRSFPQIGGNIKDNGFSPPKPGWLDGSSPHNTTLSMKGRHLGVPNVDYIRCRSNCQVDLEGPAGDDRERFRDAGTLG